MFRHILSGSAATLALMTALTSVVYAQETSSSIRGFVTGPNGEPAANVEVVIIHVPTGTRTTARTNAAGIFEASGLRVGGPFVIELSSDQYRSARITDVFTNLGETAEINLALEASAPEEIVVEAETIGAGTLKTGPSTSFTAEEVQALPSISRDPKDIARIDPFVTIEPSNSDAIIIAGQNSRNNSFTVDAVRVNDDFGLNANGYPTQRSPISLEAIGALSVNIAPYSVVNNKFTGGNINVVTKSGTNNFSGSLFYEFTDENFRNEQIGRTKVTAPFEEELWGASLGGPIWPNRAFFFGAYEEFEAIRPFQSGPSDSSAAVKTNTVTSANVTTVENELATHYLYSFEQANSILTPGSLIEPDEKTLGKIDINIFEGHRLAATYQKTEGTRLVEGIRATSTNLPLLGNYYTLGDELESYTIDVFSDWTANFSTQFTYSNKEVFRIQDPRGGSKGNATVSGDEPTEAGQVTITGFGSSQITAGPDVSRHGNELENSTEFFKFNARLVVGRHSLLAGYERDEFQVRNLFIQRSEGDFEFTGLANFQAGTVRRLRYQNAFADVNNDGFLNELDAEVNWGYELDTFYVEDTWDITDRFTLLSGVRYDVYSMDEQPIENPFFVSRYGFSNNVNLDGLDVLLPRFGFNWLAGDNTEVTGGLGLFSGGGPNVWVSNNLSNDGMRLALIDCQRNAGGVIIATSTCSIADATPVLTIPVGSDAILDVPASLEALLANPALQDTFRRTSGVNSQSEDFEIPSSWRSNVEVTHFLDTGGDYPWVLKAGVLFGKTRHATIWRDLRAGSTPQGTAPDGRPIYRNAAQRAAFIGVAGSDFGNDVQLTSTDEGESWIWTFGVDRTFGNNIVAGVSYTNQDVLEAQPGTSSVAFSNFSQYATSDQNKDFASTANYEIEHSFKGRIGWKHAFFGDNDTEVAMFAEYRSGLPYSLTFRAVQFSGGNNNTSTDGINVFGDAADASRHLIYVPTSTSDPRVTYVNSTTGVTAATTQANLDAFINSSGLSGYRGSIAERNAFKSPDVLKIDLKLSQELPAFFPNGAKLKLYANFENVANMLNDQWGLLEQVEFPYYTPIVDVSINNNGTPGDFTDDTYRYSNFRAPATSLTNADAPGRSQWLISFGARYEF